MSGGEIFSLISVPFFTGAIGYVTNWSGVLMLFYPVHFRGFRIPGLATISRFFPRKIRQVPLGFSPDFLQSLKGQILECWQVEFGRPSSRRVHSARREAFRALPPSERCQPNTSNGLFLKDRTGGMVLAMG